MVIGRRLPTELLQLILGHVNEQRDLHQCVLVNRLFYRTLIKKLWNSPTERSRSSMYNVVTLINCLCQSVPHSFYPISLGHQIQKITWHNHIPAEDFCSLLSLTPLVNKLRLESKKLGNETMEQISRFCPRLQKLVLLSSLITHQSITFLTQYCPHLYELSLLYCTRLDYRTFLALKDSGLKRLYIGKCEWLTTKHTARYFGELKELTHLTLDYCWVRGDFMQRFGSIAYLPNLISFELCGPGRSDSPVDDHVMIPWLTSHPLLESICLIDSSQITDHTLLVMAKYLPRLRRLRLSFSKDISLRGVLQLVKGCRQLSYLSVSGPDLVLPRVEGKEPWFLDDLNEVGIRWIRLNLPLDPTGAPI